MLLEQDAVRAAGGQPVGGIQILRAAGHRAGSRRAAGDLHADQMKLERVQEITAGSPNT
jgi:hypothetical protein